MDEGARLAYWAVSAALCELRGGDEAGGGRGVVAGLDAAARGGGDDVLAGGCGGRGGDECGRGGARVPVHRVLDVAAQRRDLDQHGLVVSEAAARGIGRDDDDAAPSRAAQQALLLARGGRRAREELLYRRLIAHGVKVRVGHGLARRESFLSGWSLC